MKKILIFCFSINTCLSVAQSFDVENAVGDLIDLKYAFDHAHILSYYPLQGKLSIANILNLKENKTHLILLGTNGLHLDSLFLNNSSIKDFYLVSEHIFFVSTNDKFYIIDYTEQKLEILRTRGANKKVIAFANDRVEVAYTTKAIAKRRILNIYVQFPNRQEELEYKFKDVLSKDEFPVSLQWPDRKYYIDDKFYLPLGHSNSILEIDFQQERINNIDLPQYFSAKAQYILYDYLLKKWFVVEMISHYRNKLYEFDINKKELYFLEEIKSYPSWVNGGTIYFRDYVNHNLSISTKELKIYYLRK